MREKKNSEDSLYAKEQKMIKDFVFDQSVADVFEDMIERSVPGYRAIVNMIGCLAEEYVKPDTNCYDLGSSLGAVSLTLLENIDEPNVKIFAVDNSAAMIEKCKTNLLKARNSDSGRLVSEEIQNKEVCPILKKNGSCIFVELLHENIQNVDIQQASMVVLNFTLQFVEKDKRQAIIQKIYDGLVPGGVLVISEKIAFADAKENDIQIKLHENFKRINGYSDLEIAQKRTALENVLIPDTVEEHIDRLKSAGFSQAHTWFQCFNFISMVAFK